MKKKHQFLSLYILSMLSFIGILCIMVTGDYDSEVGFIIEKNLNIIPLILFLLVLIGLILNVFLNKYNYYGKNLNRFIIFNIFTLTIIYELIDSDFNLNDVNMFIIILLPIYILYLIIEYIYLKKNNKLENENRLPSGFYYKEQLIVIYIVSIFVFTVFSYLISNKFINPIIGILLGIILFIIFIFAYILRFQTLNKKIKKYESDLDIEDLEKYFDHLKKNYLSLETENVLNMILTNYYSVIDNEKYLEKYKLCYESTNIINKRFFNILSFIYYINIKEYDNAKNQLANLNSLLQNSNINIELYEMIYDMEVNNYYPNKVEELFKINNYSLFSNLNNYYILFKYYDYYNNEELKKEAAEYILKHGEKLHIIYNDVSKKYKKNKN